MKPIALYTGNYTIGFLNSDKTLKVGEPLYTAPRELSDDEIRKVIDGTWWVGTEEEIRFKIAKAVLEKASEK